MTFAIQFPSYPADQMPAVPFGFVDSSWRQDVCPSFESAALSLRIWADYPDASHREFSDGARFRVCSFDVEGSLSADLFESDCFPCILSFVRTYAPAVPANPTTKDSI